jgi:triosephosphate isomerase
VTRPRLIAGNWKMHMLAAEARRLAADVATAAAARPSVQVAVFPAYTALAAVREALAGSRVFLGAQACHEADHGAHTGEVSAPMLADAGVSIVLCGHSERRAAGESDASVGKRARAALRSRLRPLVCVGETLAERDAGQTDAVLARQFAAAFADVAAPELDAIDLAYEPVWAIGTGRTATPETAAAAHASLRALLVGKFGAAGRGPRILYGGSVKAGNAAELLAAPDVGGLLVGGASLDAAQFRPIVESVQEPST